MGSYAFDVLFGILLVLSICISIAGLIVYRYRRDIGPIIVACSGIFGMSSSILFALDSSNFLETPLPLQLSLLAVFVISFVIGVMTWRGTR